MKYYESQNVLFRGNGPPNLPGEMLVNGQWVPSKGSNEAKTFGRELSEEEAKAFAGDDWPQEAAAEEAPAQ